MKAAAAKQNLQGDLQCDTHCKANIQTLQYTFPLQLGKLDNPNLCNASHMVLKHMISIKCLYIRYPP